MAFREATDMHSPWRDRSTIEEFLEELAFSDTKLELYDGRIVGFAGGSVAHGALCARLIGLFLAARRPGCEVYTSDVAIAIGRATYVFPDLSYSCEPVIPGATSLAAPLVVAEVISPQSGRRDRVEKLDAYQKLASLRDYLLVDSLSRNVTLFSRAESGSFVQRDLYIGDDAIGGAEATIALTSIDVRFTLAELYDDITI